MIRAVLFDMDGTLFDSERLYGEGWIRAGLTEEQYRQLIGRSRTNNDAMLTAWGYDPAKLRSIRDAAVEEVLQREGISLKPGARVCLQWLQERGIPAAIATSSPKETAERYLHMTELRSYFALVLSGSNLERGKPFPDIFLEGARLLGERPENCLVAEDSFNGVRAGRNAGMYTVMIPDLIPADEEMRGLADAVLQSLEELPDWISRTNQGKELPRGSCAE